MSSPWHGDPSDAEVDARFAELIERFYSPAHDDGRGHADSRTPLPPLPDPPGHGLDWPSRPPLDDRSFGDGSFGDGRRFDDPSAFDPSAFDPSAFDPSAFDPSAFDEDAFDEDAFDETGALDQAPLPGEPLPVVHSDGFGPHPTGPFPRLSNPALAGTLLVLVSVTICLLSILGLPFPVWGRGLAVLGVLVGIAVLLSRLPRHDDNDPDDGAVL